MPDFAAPVERLIDELKHLPGIGQKTAQRLALHLLRSAPQDALALADAIRDAKAKIRACSICHNITDSDPCLYCVGPTRTKETICVLEGALLIHVALKNTRCWPQEGMTWFPSTIGEQDHYSQYFQDALANPPIWV